MRYSRNCARNYRGPCKICPVLFGIIYTTMTQALEDYLKTVSFLADENGGHARLTDIAARLGVSKPSAFTALKALKKQGLVEHGRYRR